MGLLQCALHFLVSYFFISYYEFLQWIGKYCFIYFMFTNEGGAYLRTKQVLCSLSWWMYLIICYSLLLDTYILQSSGITKLRNIGKQLTRRNTRALLLLFFLVPPCLYAGGNFI